MYQVQIDNIMQDIEARFEEAGENYIHYTLKDGEKIIIRTSSDLHQLQDAWFLVMCDKEYSNGRPYGQLMEARGLRELAVNIYRYPDVLPWDAPSKEEKLEELIAMYKRYDAIRTFHDKMLEFYDNFGYYPDVYHISQQNN